MPNKQSICDQITDYQKPLHIIYGDDCIEFIRMPRISGVNRVLIKVYPDCRVVVNAPVTTGDDDLIDAVKKRARWIHKKLNIFKAQRVHVAPRQYVSGESHYYLGKQYLLKILKQGKSSQQVKLLRGKLQVTVKNDKSVQIKALLYNWYKEKARDVFNRRLDVMLSQTLWVAERPTIRLQAMQMQWGSCSPGGCLTLNPHLVKAPRECIDYVILHELCHIAEHNHSDRFYRLMRQVMPEWERVKYNLDNMSEKLLNN